MNRTAMKRLGSLLAALAALALFLSPTSAPVSAQTDVTEVPPNWGLIPSGMTEGDQFRLLFVSSEEFTAERKDINKYDAEIIGLALDGHRDIWGWERAGTFRVVGSTAAVDARDNTDTTHTASNPGLPIYWLNGDKVADDYADFYDGTWDAEASMRDEFGSTVSAPSDGVWTGSANDGTEYLSGSTSRALGKSPAMYGRPNGSGGPLAGNNTASNSQQRRLYGLSGVFEVGPPLPPCSSLRKVDNLSVASASGEITATWDETEDCSFAAAGFTIKVEWSLLFDANAGTPGDEDFSNGAWNEYRTVACEESPVTDTCTLASGPLHAGQRYSVRVWTVDGNQSVRPVPRDVWTITGASATPVTEVTAVAENASCTVVSGQTSTPVDLSWEAVSGVSRYQVWRAGPDNTFTRSFQSDRVLVSDKSGTSHTDHTETRARMWYQYVVLPRIGGSAALDGPWVAGEVFTPGAEAPRKVSVEDGVAGDNNFMVHWQAPADNGGCPVIGYSIEVYVYPGPSRGAPLNLATSTTAGPTDTSKEILSMPRSTPNNDGAAQYYVVVKAATAHGEGVPGAALFTDWTRPPTAPRNVRFTDQRSGALPLGWDPPDSDGGSPVTSYTVMYQPNGDGSGSGSTETRSGGGYGSRGVRSGGVYGLDAKSGVGANPRSENGDGRDGGGSVETSGTSVTIEGLTDGVEYIVRVVAHNAVGESPPSDPITGTPGGPENTPATGTPTISGTARVGETLTASVGDIGDDDGIANAEFSYQWLADGAEITDATGGSYTLVDADADKAIKVRASFTDDEGNAESLTSAATAVVEEAEPTEPPPKPTNLTARVNGDGSITLSWEAPDDDSVTGYQILRRRPTQGEKTLLVYVADTSSTATTYTDTNVKAGIRHVYRVKAINVAGLSRWSNYVNPTP